jgi:hypothetical protein
LVIVALLDSEPDSEYGSGSTDLIEYGSNTYGSGSETLRNSVTLLDFFLLFFRHIGADEAEAIDKRKRGKQNPDSGFSSFEQATFRKYTGLAKQIKPDMELYQVQKEKVRNFSLLALPCQNGFVADTEEGLYFFGFVN